MEKLIIIGTSEDNNYVGGKPAFEKIKEIIEKVKPVFVLAEKLENYSIENEHHFYLIMKKKKLSNMTSIGEVKELIKLCHKNKIKLIGIDFENFILDMKQQALVKKHKPATEEEEKEFEALAKRRENKHVKMIKKYLYMSRKSIVVIVGSWHIRKGSQIRREFKNLEGGCKLIFPVNAKGEMRLGPTKEKLGWGEEEL